MKSNYKLLGKYIQPVDERNTELLDLPLMGLSVSKVFFPTIANLVGTDMKTYKIVYKNQFTYIADTSRRGDKIAIALNDGFDKMLVSQAYTPFEVKDTNELEPGYLMMWFRRPEFDRYARFKSHGSAREIFDWEDMCNVSLPIPHIDKQREIVKEYNTIINRIKLNEQLSQKLEETTQAIYKHWFIDFEFPDGNGKPYKSNGGEMVFNEGLEKEIPKGWQLISLSSISKIKAGGDRPSKFSEYKTKECCVPIYSNGVTNEGLYGFTNKANYPQNSITISARGTIGYCKLRTEDFDAIVRLIVVIPKLDIEAHYIFDFISRVQIDDSGSVQSQLTIPQVSSLKVIYPVQNIMLKYHGIITPISKNIANINLENDKLKTLQSILLSKLATIEN